MTQATLQKLREAFLIGASDEEACAYAEIAPSSLYNYQTAHPEYLEQKQAWKLDPILKAKATVYKSLNRKEVAQWYLERKAPEEFSPKPQSLTQINIGNSEHKSVVFYIPDNGRDKTD